MKYQLPTPFPTPSRYFVNEPLAWFLVDEYSGLTGRKGTTVVSVTRVLWFCVASQTSQRKKPETESYHTCSSGRRGSRVTRDTWESTL